MTTLGERLKHIRKTQNPSKTQSDFAATLGITRDAYKYYELNKVVPSGALLKLICTTYNVNQKWLETGDGDPFVEQPTDQAEFLARQYGLDAGGLALLRAVARMYAELDAPQREVILAELHASLDAAIADPASRRDEKSPGLSPEAINQ